MTCQEICAALIILFVRQMRGDTHLGRIICR